MRDQILHEKVMELFPYLETSEEEIGRMTLSDTIILLKSIQEKIPLGEYHEKLIQVLFFFESVQR